MILSSVHSFKQLEWTRQFHNHRLASTLVILVVYLSPKQINLGTTWVGVPTEETPYISHFCKRYEIVVQVNLVISKSKGIEEILRDIRSST